MHADALKILAETPIVFPQSARERLLRDEDVDLAALAEDVVKGLNKGQQWALACAQTRVRLEQQRRAIVRDRERSRVQANGHTPVVTDSLDACLAKAQEIFKAWGDEIRLEVTEELLASSFSLGNGQRITWGDATVEDHRVRAEMLEKQGVSTLQTSLLHRIAIERLQTSGASCLTEETWRS